MGKLQEEVDDADEDEENEKKKTPTVWYKITRKRKQHLKDCLNEFVTLVFVLFNQKCAACSAPFSQEVWNSVWVIWIKWNGKNCTYPFIPNGMLWNKTNQKMDAKPSNSNSQKTVSGTYQFKLWFLFFLRLCIFLPLFLTKYFINNWLNKRLLCCRRSRYAKHRRFIWINVLLLNVHRNIFKKNYWQFGENLLEIRAQKWNDGVAITIAVRDNLKAFIQFEMQNLKCQQRLADEEATDNTNISLDYRKKGEDACYNTVPFEVSNMHNILASVGVLEWIALWCVCSAFINV